MTVVVGGLAFFAAGVAAGYCVARCRQRREVRITDEQVLAHEIRTPLSLISSAAEILIDADANHNLSVEQYKLLNTITVNAARAIDVAELFLLSAKMDQPGFTPTFAACDIRALVRASAQELRETSAVPIVVDDPGDPLMMCADAGLLRHALWNVINNAVRHADSASDITVSTFPTSTGVVVSVADLGRGMSDTEQDRMFVPFAQFALNSATSTNRASRTTPTGAGLGMTITLKIVHAHGGKVVVDSRSEHGTVVLIVLPKEPHG